MKKNWPEAFQLTDSQRDKWEELMEKVSKNIELLISKHEEDVKREIEDQNGKNCENQKEKEVLKNTRSTSRSEV